jgi:hypothetical protein
VYRSCKRLREISETSPRPELCEIDVAFHYDEGPVFTLCSFDRLHIDAIP